MTDLSQILIGELGRNTEMFLAKIPSLVGQLLSEKKTKIVIYDKARVNGGTNYDYPGQGWVLKLV